MNPVQMAQQIKHELQRVTWPVTGGEVVFGAHTSAVVVHAGLPGSPEAIPRTFPWAMVIIDSGVMDENDPNLIGQTFRVVVAARVMGHPSGEYAVIGGASPSSTSSSGRGVGELMERVSVAVGNLTGVDGCRILLSGRSTVGPMPIAGDQTAQFVVGEVVLSGVCSAQAAYASPRNLRREGSVWKWDGTHCARRFDFLQFRLVAKQGQDPSWEPGNGTTVYTGTSPEASVPASSGNVYTIFADYNSRGGSSVELSSTAEVGSWKVY